MDLQSLCQGNINRFTLQLVSATDNVPAYTSVDVLQNEISQYYLSKKVRGCLTVYWLAYTLCRGARLVTVAGVCRRL